jgi:type II secretory pathway component HofQ
VRTASVAVILALSGCAHEARPSLGTIDGALASFTAAEGDETSVRTIARRSFAPVRITPVRPRLPRGPLVDARFQGAPLESALRLLAEAANVGLVIGEGVEGTVSLDLRGVSPLEAMEALAEAHGLTISRVGRTLIARRL